MELRVFWATLVRRWYFVVAALAFTVGATFLVVSMVGPTYEAEGLVLVFPPVATVQRETQLQAQGNPYLVLSGVGQARDIVIRQLMSKSMQEQLAEQSPGSSYEAIPDNMNSAPVILLTVDADSASTATSALAVVMDHVPVTLADLQGGLNLPADALITSKPLIADPQPYVVRKGQIRAGIIAGVAMLGLSLLVIGLIDGILTARLAAKKSNRRHALSTPDDSGQVAESPPAARTQGARRLGPRAAVTRWTSPSDSGSGAQQSAVTRLESLESLSIPVDAGDTANTAKGR